MRKVIASKALVQTALDAQREFINKEPRFAENMEQDFFDAMKAALEAAIPAYLDSDEPGVWQYGINYRSLIGGPFDRFEWHDTREKAVEAFEMASHPRGQFRDRGDGHGLAVRPCRRWIGRPFWEETFDELDEWDNVPQGQFMLHRATSEQAEDVFDKVIDYIYEAAEGMSVDVTGSFILSGVPKGRIVKDPKEVPLP